MKIRAIILMACLIASLFIQPLWAQRDDNADYSFGIGDTDFSPKSQTFEMLLYKNSKIQSDTVVAWPLTNKCWLTVSKGKAQFKTNLKEILPTDAYVTLKKSFSRMLEPDQKSYVQRNLVGWDGEPVKEEGVYTYEYLGTATVSGTTTEVFIRVTLDKGMFGMFVTPFVRIRNSKVMFDAEGGEIGDYKEALAKWNLLIKDLSGGTLYIPDKPRSSATQKSGQKSTKKPPLKK